MSDFTIFTDGACAGNPGPGGWGAIVIAGDRRREMSGYEPATTNNRMEMMAAVQALRSLPPGSSVELHTDSQYLKNGMQSWLARWKRNGWRTADRKPVKNEDLWRTLDALAATHSITWHWVRGHDGHPENERCDALANEAIRMRRGIDSDAVGVA
jgi:ribonuclease HI